MNTLGLQQLSLDVEAVISFAERNPVKDLKECFVQLTQTLSMFIQGDIEVYLDLNQRVDKYPNVKATTVLAILQKYQSLGVASRLFKSKNLNLVSQRTIQRAVQDLSRELGQQR